MNEKELMNEELEVYGEPKEPKVEKKGFFAKIVEYLRQRNEVKRKERRELDQIRSEARKEAIRGIKPELVKKYKQEEIDRLTGKKKGILQQIGKEFKESNIGSSDKIREMLGKPPQQQQQFQQQTKQNFDSSQGISNEKISEMMSFKPNRETQKRETKSLYQHDFDIDSKLKKALGKK
jgi:hypothetical protein